MLPGKQYSPEDIALILLRRAWIVILTCSVGAGAAYAVAKRLPNQFRSTTLIMLIPQRIPDAYVKAAVTSRIEDRLNTLEDQILSRSRLERIILDLDLYRNLRQTLTMEEVVQRMRDNDITVKTEGKESFRVSYVSREAKTAQQTTDRLASLFIEENMRDRENVAEDTNQFLESQLEDAKRQLVEHEKKLEEYRNRFGGELPSQAAANLQAIQNAQVQLQNLADTADRARERRLVLERQIIDLQNEAQPGVLPASGTPDPLIGESTAQQLQAAQARLQALLQHAKPDHPDVRAAERTIRDLQAKLDAEGRRPSPGAVAIPVTPAEMMRDRKIRDLRLQMEDIDRQVADKQADEKRLRADVAAYQAKLDAVPKRESDLVELTRDYATLQTTYQNLLTKREEAKLAANLERRNIGEQFKVLDPARVPEKPFSPKRLQIDAGGAAGGLIFGLLIVGLLEYWDSSFKSEDDVVRVLNLRVLALVPLMETQVERRRRKGRLALIGVSVVLLAGSGAAIALWRWWS